MVKRRKVDCGRSKPFAPGDQGPQPDTLTDPHSPWKAGDAVSVELVDPLYFDATGARVERGERVR